MRMGKDPFEEQRLLGQIQLGQSQVLEAFIEKRMGVLNKQLQDEREENYRLRLRIQEDARLKAEAENAVLATLQKLIPGVPETFDDPEALLLAVNEWAEGKWND